MNTIKPKRRHLWKSGAMVILVAMRSTAVLITRESLNRPYTKRHDKISGRKVIKPRRVYNVNLVYNRNENEREKLNAYYDRVMAKKSSVPHEKAFIRKLSRKK